MPSLSKLVQTPLSMTQVKEHLPDIPVILYSKFAQLKTLPPACVYLFLTNQNYGHFCAVFNRGNVVELFDSYGIKPEAEHNFVKIGLLEHLHERDDLILNMAKKNGWSVSYNHTQLQSWNPKVETCGRHCVSRVLKQSMDIDEYVQWLQGVAKKANVSNDILVSYLVQ